MFSMRLDHGYLPCSLRSLQRTTCSYTAPHDVRRDPGQVDRSVVCRRRRFLPTLRWSCRRLFVSSILQYIPRLPLFTFLTLGTLLHHHYCSLSIFSACSSSKPRFLLTPYLSVTHTSLLDPRTSQSLVSHPSTSLTSSPSPLTPPRSHPRASPSPSAEPFA